MSQTPQADLWELYVRSAEKASQERNFDKAEKLLSGALGDLQSAAAKRTLAIAEVQKHLANLFQRQSHYSEADSYYKEAIKTIDGDTNGNASNVDFHFIAALLEDYAACLCEQGKFKESLPFREKALAILLINLEQNRPILQSMRRVIAATYLVEGDFERAKIIYQEMLDVVTSLYGPENIDAADLTSHLALVAYLKGEYKDAEDLYFKSMTIQKLEGSPDATWTASEFGLACCAQGKHEQAKPFCHRALEEREHLQGKALRTEGEQIANSLSELADVYCSHNEFEEAAPLCKQALACRMHIPATNVSDRTSKMRFFAHLLRKAKRFTEADRVETNAT